MVGSDGPGLIAHSHAGNKRAMHRALHKGLGSMSPCRWLHGAPRFSSGSVIPWHTCDNLAKVDKRSDAFASLGATEVRGATH